MWSKLCPLLLLTVLRRWGNTRKEWIRECFIFRHPLDSQAPPQHGHNSLVVGFGRRLQIKRNCWALDVKLFTCFVSNSCNWTTNKIMLSMLLFLGLSPHTMRRSFLNSTSAHKPHWISFSTPFSFSFSLFASPSPHNSQHFAPEEIECLITNNASHFVYLFQEEVEFWTEVNGSLRLLFLRRVCFLFPLFYNLSITRKQYIYFPQSTAPHLTLVGRTFLDNSKKSKWMRSG